MQQPPNIYGAASPYPNNPINKNTPPQPHGLHDNNEPENRKVKRKLRSFHIFLIVISGTIGMGLFENSGEILAIAGPRGGITAFSVVGVLVILLMEGIAEMVTHWPISNAMIEFVRVFVDRELSLVIGVAYALRYAYSISFSTLIIAAADLTTYWTWSTTVSQITFIAFVPLFLGGLNCFGVLYYGNVEALCGIIKISLVFLAFGTMIAINHLVLPPTEPGQPQPVSSFYIDQGFQNNPSIASNTAIATLVAFPIATYAYVGVEIVAVTAVEAMKPEKSLRPAARHIAWITALIYIGSVVSYYYNVGWDDPQLPPYHGNPRPPVTYPHPEPEGQKNTSSIVIIATLNADNSTLSGALNAFLVLAVLSTANTALYVSSRTIWGLACRLDPKLITSRNTLKRWFAKLSTTTPVGRVPAWALLISSLSFWWLLPFLLLAKSTTAVNIQQTMSGAATVAVVIVWASQCLAFIQYRTWLQRHQNRLQGDYAKFDHFTPSTQSLKFQSNFSTYFGRLPSILGLIFCVLTVAVFATSSWWIGGVAAVDVAAAFSGPGVLLILWLVLKASRYVRGDNFKWMETIHSWEELRVKLDGLSNAIHKREFNYKEKNAIPLEVQSNPSQIHLVGEQVLNQPQHVNSPLPPLPPSNPPPGRNPYQLGINVLADQHQAARSTGYTSPTAYAAPRGYLEPTVAFSGEPFDPMQPHSLSQPRQDRQWDNLGPSYGPGSVAGAGAGAGLSQQQQHWPLQRKSVPQR